MSKLGKRLIAAAREALAIVRGESEPVRVWHVDRDGRVRIDTDRPVVLKGRPQP